MIRWKKINPRALYSKDSPIFLLHPTQNPQIMTFSTMLRSGRKEWMLIAGRKSTLMARNRIPTLLKFALGLKTSDHWKLARKKSEKKNLKSIRKPLRTSRAYANAFHFWKKLKWWSILHNLDTRAFFSSLWKRIYTIYPKRDRAQQGIDANKGGNKEVNPDTILTT